ncbi:BT_3987 domain-containing protein [Prevotella sp. KH2C16]|uniref:BT_3987 domain-containing protein n=1 Tax=Prevotella sp. KH2C16 TaxID=1855325 RepID=UPI0008E548A7|nr:DUF1735 domain-containing protein [Prevotella sp. KH2C16]SFG02993.1 F5/8 type C domain-containing protein [Prevotella sp. KH2C16]
MKLKNILLLSGALFFGTAALTGCSDDDDTYDVYGSDYNIVFFDTNTSTVNTKTIYNTPIGIFGTVDGAFNVKAQYNTDATIMVGAEVDTTLVGTYNVANKASFKSLPAQALSAIQISQVVIKPGTNAADTTLNVTLPKEACTYLTEEAYLVPVRLKILNDDKGTSSYKAGIDDTYSVAYIVLNNAAKDFIKVSSEPTQTVSIANTPAGVFGNIAASYDFSMYANDNSEVSIRGEFDNSLITAYNTESGKAYAEVPANILSQLKISAGKIDAGQTSSDTPLTVSDPNNASHALPVGEYVIPVRLTASYSGGQTSPMSNVYIVVKVNETLINDNATAVSGSAISNSAWMALSASGAGLTVDGFNTFKSQGYWPFSVKESAAEFVIDLGAVHQITGFNLDSMVGDGFTVEFSGDNSNWTSIGNTSEHTPVNIGSGWSSNYVFVFYGAISTRYVRVKAKLNTDSYYWNYLSYSWGKRYASISSINFYE